MWHLNDGELNNDDKLPGEGVDEEDSEAEFDGDDSLTSVGLLFVSLLDCEDIVNY